MRRKAETEFAFSERQWRKMLKDQEEEFIFFKFCILLYFKDYNTSKTEFYFEGPSNFSIILVESGVYEILHKNATQKLLTKHKTVLPAVLKHELIPYHSIHPTFMDFQRYTNLTFPLDQ
jgi:hypothetical protein